MERKDVVGVNYKEKSIDVLRMIKDEETLKLIYYFAVAGLNEERKVKHEQ